MGSRLQQGFTIIEVMLFLAITGLLLAGVMVGASNNLNSQHYRDGAEGLRQQIAAQFDKVYSLTNNNLSSGGEGDSSDPCVVISGGSLAPNIPRGTSDCFYVGRLLQISPSSGDGSTLKISPVVARRKTGATSPMYGQQNSSASVATQGSSDVADLYQIALYDKNSTLVSSELLNWGLAAVGQRSPGGVAERLTTNILILRSPVDGNITTYLVDTSAKNADSDPNHLENQFNVDHSKDITICVADLSGNLDPTDRMGVIIHRAATGPGDVESKTVGVRMLRYKKRRERGDTLIEVLFAVAVFSAIAVGSVVIMNQGIASAQNSLEISLVRNAIDSQAELLRHLNDAKLSSLGRNQTDDSIQWDNAVAHASPQAWDYDAISSFEQCTPGNHDFPSSAFFINPETGKVEMGQGNFVQPSTFSQIIPASVTGTTTKSAMLWVQAVQNNTATAQNSAQLKNTRFYDFHIRACWDSAGANAPVMKLGTIVRLYVPNN